MQSGKGPLSMWTLPWSWFNKLASTLHQHDVYKIYNTKFEEEKHKLNEMYVTAFEQFNCHSDTHVFMFIITQTLIWFKCKKLKSSYAVGFTKSLNMKKCVNTVLNNKIVPEGKLFFSRRFLNTPNVFTWTLASPLDALKE